MQTLSSPWVAKLSQMNTKEINGAAQTDGCEGGRCEDYSEASLPRVRIPVHRRRPEILDPLFFIGVPIESRTVNAACTVH